MTNLNIAKLYLAANAGTTATALDAAIADTSANTAVQALSTAAFVEAAYQAAFGRAADAEGLAYWSDRIDNGGMAKDDAFMTALNYGATVYVAPTVDAPLVIGTVTFTAATAEGVNDVAVAANKATAEAAAAAISVGEAAAIVATVTEVATTVTAASDAVAAVVLANTPDTGVTYALTSANQAIESGTGNDTFTDGVDTGAAATTTLNASDILIDASSTDNDTLSLEWTDDNAANATDAATITNVENINVDVNVFNGSTTLFSAANVTGANITLSSTKLGYDGVAGVTGTANNTVTAGSNVTALTVAGLTGGAIDAGSATTVTMDGTAARANTVTINGDLTLVNTASTLTTLDVTAASDVTYTPTIGTLKTTITGDNDVNLTMANGAVLAATSIVKDTTGTVTLIDDGAIAVSAFDTTNFAVDKIMVGAATTSTTVTVASGQIIETNANVATLEALTTSTAVTDTVTVNLGHNITTALILDDTTATGSLTSTINATRTDGVTIAALTATAKDVILTGSVDVTATAVDVATLDASATSGALTLTTINATAETITTGTGVATITVGGTTDQLTVISGTGNVTVNTVGAQAGVIAITGNSGVETLEMAILGAATIAFDGGAGASDKIIMNDVISDGVAATGASTLTAGVWAVQNVENIVVANTDVVTSVGMVGSINDAVDTLALSMNASHLTGQTYTVSQEEALDTLFLTVAGDATGTTQAIDLSNITMQTGDTVAINGQGAIANTITGTNVADTITAGASTATTINTLTGGAGDDTFVFTAGDSLEATMNSITDYQAAILTADNDTLDLGLAGGATYLDATDSITDIATNLGSTVPAIFAEAVNAVDAVVSATGIMTLVGTASDVALVNTLAEWIDIAEQTMLDATGNLTAVTDVMAFEFDDNTYVLSVPATGASDIIELTGLTGVAGISNAAAADGIFVL